VPPFLYCLLQKTLRYYGCCSATEVQHCSKQAGCKRRWKMLLLL
jgi:hypothetical protein